MPINEGRVSPVIDGRRTLQKLFNDRRPEKFRLGLLIRAEAGAVGSAGVRTMSFRQRLHPNCLGNLTSVQWIRRKHMVEAILKRL